MWFCTTFGNPILISEKVGIDKGKKRARSLSPGLPEQGSSDVEIISESLSQVKPVTKRIKDSTHPVTKPAEPITHFATQAVTSRSEVQRPSSMPSTSPTAERISQALKKQQIPTNKEMNSFRKLLANFLTIHSQGL